MAFNKEKFLSRFIDEAREHIDSLNRGLLTLEKDPNDKGCLDGVFRSAHTIKGSSRMMKLNAITDVAHKLEDALDALRQGNLQMSKGLSNLLFKGIDTIAAMLEDIASGTEITVATDTICEQLEAAARGEGIEEIPETAEGDNPAASAAASESPVAEKEPSLPSPSTTPPMAEKAQSIKPLVPVETIRIGSDKLDELIKLMGEIGSGQSQLKHRLYDLQEIERFSSQNVVALSHAIEKNTTGQEQVTDLIQTAQSLASSLKRLSSTLREDINIQELLSGELQDKSIKMRMLPLSTLFDTFHRTVRDMAMTFGKNIDFIVEGGETELDKKIIEKMGDPLLHMIRNSIDHGIEETGRIKLSAGYEGGNVLIELSDDGRGISIEKISAKALKKKLIDEVQLENMSDSEIINLIFTPGFSTSDIITDISGRGVGMDVVRKNIIDALKGSIQIDTKIDQGTSIFIRLPLTMAIMPILFFTSADKTFGVPADFVDETLRIAEADLIDVLGERAIRLREQIIPIVDMATILHLSPGRSGNGDFLILIMKLGNEKLGVRVDSLLNEEDFVVKPLPSHMKNIKMVSGVIISGKNEIVNVLHVPEMFQAAKAMNTSRSKKVQEKPEDDVLNILLVDDSISTREIEKSILESYGYVVSMAEDGVEALEKAEAFVYDLVITDVEMPNMDGFSLTQHLKNHDTYRDIPIILVTSRDKEADKRKGISVGADAYIVKGSFEQTTLIDTVESLIG